MPTDVEDAQPRLLVIARCDACGGATQHAIDIEDAGDRAILHGVCLNCGTLTMVDIGEGNDAAAPA